MFNHTRYLVICKNERQAKLLFENVLTYWSVFCRPRRSLRGPLLVNREMKVIHDPLTSVVVIPERKVFDFTSGKAGIQCRLVNGLQASRWLDRKFKEKKDGVV